MKQQIEMAIVCHKGCVRGNNEDNFFVNGDYMPLSQMDTGAVFTHTFTDASQLYGIMDGMGGGSMGERASAIAAKSLLNVYVNMKREKLPDLIERWALKINRAVQEDCKAHDADLEGTTMTLLALRDGTAYVGNVGDTRAYLLRDGKLVQKSWDHSVVADLYRQGKLTAEQARKSPQNNMIYRYLGMNENEIPQKGFVYTDQWQISEGDRYMLCSDGLSDLLSDGEIRMIMSSVRSPLECARRLVSQALEMGGKDNTTCIVADAGKPDIKESEETKVQVYTYGGKYALMEGAKVKREVIDKSGEVTSIL